MTENLSQTPIGGLRPHDRLFLIYVAFTGFVLLGGGFSSPTQPALLSIHILFCALPFLLSRVRDREAFLWRFPARAYPLLLLLFFYYEIEVLNNIAASGYHDETVLALQESLGLSGPGEWLRSTFPYTWFEVLMSVGYFSFYFFLPVAGIPLAVQRRWFLLEKFVFQTFFAFIVCYTVYIFYPVLGPFFDLHPLGSFDGKDPMTRMTYTLVNNWGSHGAAFPSSHVATALQIVLLSYRWVRPAAYILGPFAVLLTLSTMYGEYHYPVDAVVGVVVGVVLWAVAPLVNRLFEHFSTKPRHD